MRTLRVRLFAAFLAATALPFGATVWIASALLERSLGYATTDRIDRLSRTLEVTVRELYQRERDTLRREALEGTATGTAFPVSRQAEWPDAVRAFWDSAEAERFSLAGPAGDRIELLQREALGVRAFSRDLQGVRMNELSAQYREARSLVASLEQQDLRRGFRLTLVVLLAGAWLVSLVPLALIADRISRPVRQLTDGLHAFAADGSAKALPPSGDDEVGRAVSAFNRLTAQLTQSRARLVHLTQMASWQSLARKTGHELKNSLTPIRLTVEEMVARAPEGESRAFNARAAQIVVDEVEALERRVRAFSEFATEPPVTLEPVDLNTVVSERVALLSPTHTHCRIDVQLDDTRPVALADRDLLKSTVHNLLQNAGEAASDGAVLVLTRGEARVVDVEVHDSGPGLPPEVAETLFEPTISFKRHGMGLGLSIARRNAVLCGGDVTVIESTLGGAAFRVRLPRA